MLRPDIVLLILIAAHVAADFVLQPDRWVREKRRPSILLPHALVHAALSYVLLGAWGLWLVPLLVFVAHFLIDFVKSRAGRDGLTAFALDQIAHVASLVAIARLIDIPSRELFWVDLYRANFLGVLVVFTGLVVAVRVSGIIVAKLVQPFLDQMQVLGKAGPAARGFENGGRTIGNLERALIFVFVIAGQPAALGFLLAAKSILRFGEVRDPDSRMEAEYIIIGTMWSFLLGIVSSMACRYVLTRIV